MPQPQASGTPGGEPTPRATFGQVFAVGEFRALWVAQVLSVAGDQLARVALTLLVFDRTRSPLLAALTFAASVLPTFIGGVVLSGLADRLPRREVMIVSDLIRGLLVAVMVVPGVPVSVLVALLFLVTLVGAPFSSARAALYPDILQGDLYVMGTAVTLTTVQFAQVIGFAAAGVAVALVGVRVSLMLDAATFFFSALITLTCVARRPASAQGGAVAVFSLSSMGTGIRLVFGASGLRTLMLLGWLAAFVDVYEGVAVPLAKELGGGPVAVGLILASGALGAAVGTIGFSRFVTPPMRLRMMIPLAIAACAVLVVFVEARDLVVALIILTLSGAFSSYQVAASSAFVVAVPPEQRSQAFGLAQGGMSLGQATTMILAGAAVRYAPPSGVIAAGGALGALICFAVAWDRTRSSTQS